ncbi:MAG: hypothetical protein V7713_10910, partial [Marinobacter sp.]
MAAGLRYGLIQQYTGQIQANLENEARSMANSMEREFMVHADSIRRMASRLQKNPQMSEREWREDARNYLVDF